MPLDSPILRTIGAKYLEYRREVRILLAFGFWFMATVGVAMPCAAQERSAHTAQSSKQLWFGTMSIKDVRQFRFVLVLTREDATWLGLLKSLDEGGREFAMSGIVCTESNLKFELAQTAAVYEGSWDTDGQMMKGKWKQRGQELHLAFHRVTEQPQRKIKTVWKGTIDALIQKLDVAFIELESGQLIFDSISQEAGGFFVKDESKDGEVVYRVPAVRGTFTGEYSDDKSQIVGKWSQGFTQLDLVLKIVDVEDLVAKQHLRPQTPTPPFPYVTREVYFASKATGVTLSGTLTTPRDEVAAAVVLVTGSGPQDRDESLLGHKPFWVIADHFARHGIATLRYDDRGTGLSTGDFSTATSFNFADDAEGALEHVRTLPELEGIPVGICGHSEGGLIAPIVAARNEHCDFIVMMAGTGVNGEEILYSQTKLILEAEGTSEAEIQRQTKLQRALLSTVGKYVDAPQDELEARVTQVLEKVLVEEEFESEDLAEMLRAGFEKVSTPWFRTFLTLDPRESLVKVRCPVLAINGEKDLQVDPKLNLPAIRAALEEARNSQFEIIEFPGLNHLFQACNTGAVSEYEEIEETFNTQPLEKMTEWILSLNAGD